MLRILSWSPGLDCDKTPNPDRMTLEAKQQLFPVTDFSMSNALKRKRPSFDGGLTGDVFETVISNPVIQGDQRPIQAATVTPAEIDIKQEFPSAVDSSLSTSLSAMAPPQPADPVPQQCSEKQLRRMRQTISAQLNLEILLKHKELRLIDQEIAKCQTALEQLRRCTEIPYPGSQAPSVLVSEGRGAALRKTNGDRPASSPAPWGVTDGPYARHYARWLLPDPHFDGGEVESSPMQHAMYAAVPARSTRGSFADAGKTLKSRSTGRSNTFQSLPAGYGQPKEKATGPMILKRKSDNVMVKLVCPDCGRHDFGSAQGFINHCRIGHSRSFASHDAAAEACGEPVEYDSDGTIKGAPPVSTPIAGHTHPLIRSAKLLPGPSSAPIATSFSDPSYRRTKKSRSTPMAADFLPSQQTPHLSDLVQSQGLGLNLEELVTDAKTKVELPESENEDDEMDIDSPLPVTKRSHPQVAGSKQLKKSAPVKHHSMLSHAGSSSSQDRSRRHEETLPSPPPPPPLLAMPVNRSQAHFMHPIIPSPTNESTQAPSLVDDDEEFDPQSPPSSDEIDETEVDFDVHDDEQGERTVLRGGDLTSPPTTCAPTTTARGHSKNPTESSEPHTGHDRVAFASVSPHPEDNDRKRRKITGV